MRLWGKLCCVVCLFNRQTCAVSCAVWVFYLYGVSWKHSTAPYAHTKQQHLSLTRKRSSLPVSIYRCPVSLKADHGECVARPLRQILIIPESTAFHINLLVLSHFFRLRFDRFLRLNLTVFSIFQFSHVIDSREPGKRRVSEISVRRVSLKPGIGFINTETGYKKSALYLN